MERLRVRPEEQIADLAVWALLEEAELTPKPALVDRRGSGAHHDLDLGLLRRSAEALRDSFRAMAEAADGRAPDQTLREHLALIGRAGEVRMMAATGGSNAHRGAIWILGLLVAGVASTGSSDPLWIAATAQDIAGHSDRFAPVSESNGKRVCEIFGVAGARGEALDGFPHVIEIGLPALRQSRKAGASETEAQLDALLSIMASLDDTCLLHRGGRVALDTAKRGARIALDAGGAATRAGMGYLHRLDADLMALFASPGGSADLLAATLFLDRLERELSWSV
ncbi:triphosphoribosyl-dephospho-CoA synthase [Govanella unica]|uniref:Probable 2-(5''-triphosphoribosyl)-3'-dephosphocoenzyme-A synthase n=1 Tax=Govanella unica TaxID=2975056 RepID=A0A9X3TZ98_9PROT|nr:triphosphoribosyl-dephospho-CoA synthase [Govania unica]MDA5194199.1 triphosphoribosyl-dephospho-CoA synthase [Govania unica]